MKGVEVALTRRGFLQAASASIAAGSLVELSSLTRAFAVEKKIPTYRLKGAAESTTVCPYCSVGCGAICSVVDGELVNVEGDADNPLNRGGMCAKGTAQFNIRNVVEPETGAVVANPARLDKVRYRAAGSSEWVEKDWDWAVSEIAKRVRAVREKSFEKLDAKGRVVNRTPGIAWMGGAALDNEECYLSSKLARALGVVYLEHQARI